MAPNFLECSPEVNKTPFLLTSSQEILPKGQGRYGQTLLFQRCDPAVHFEANYEIFSPALQSGA
jgi:hypothetical protein